jgi:hypothetical protein
MDSLASLAFIEIDDETGEPMAVCAADVVCVRKAGNDSEIVLRNGGLLLSSESASTIKTALDAVRDTMLAGL